MEIYAAMVDRMDQNVGRLITYLRATGRYDNTIFLFSSDNGAAGDLAQTFSVMPGELEFIARADNRLENMGAARSFALDRKSVLWGKSVSVCVDLGGGRGTQ